CPRPARGPRHCRRPPARRDTVAVTVPAPAHGSRAPAPRLFPVRLLTSRIGVLARHSIAGRSPVILLRRRLPPRAGLPPPAPPGATREGRRGRRRALRGRLPERPAPPAAVPRCVRCFPTTSARSIRVCEGARVPAAAAREAPPGRRSPARRLR